MSNITLKQINDLYKETFYIEDNAVLPFLIALVVGSRLKSPPVWCFLVGPSSGGKTELIETLAKVPFVHQVSDLTQNTFLSGMGTKEGQSSPSLLDRLGPNFVIAMKDFTTILSKSEEVQQAIIAQMREIYDGHIVKQTGTGKTLEWGKKDKKNKATFIMASTESIFKVQDKFSEMGTRALNYVLKPQDRKLTTKRALKNSSIVEENKQKIQTLVKDFIMEKIASMPPKLEELDDGLIDEIIEVADFCALARSGIDRDWKGAKKLALSAEFPMRMAKQMMAIAQFLKYCNDGILTDEYKATVFKTALDSVSKQRRIIIDTLAEFSLGQTVAIARRCNYPSERIVEWLEDLNAFGIVEQVEVVGKSYWRLKPEYKNIILRYREIQEVGESLDNDESDNKEEDDSFKDFKTF